MSHREILDLLRQERVALLRVLDRLEPDDWDADTSCPGWSVKDVAAHILGDDLSILASERDGYRTGASESPTSWAALVRLVNARNEAWVAAWRQVSPALIRELLVFTGRSLLHYYRRLDPDELGPPVAWAGDEGAPNRLRVAREYTERWVHQQQIREAVKADGLREERWVRPLLETFAHALPFALRGTAAPDGTVVALEATGEGGGRWTVRRDRGRWSLATPSTDASDTVTLDVETLWRLYTNSIAPEVARARARVDGHQELGNAILAARAIIA